MFLGKKNVFIYGFVTYDSFLQQQKTQACKKNDVKMGVTRILEKKMTPI